MCPLCTTSDNSLPQAMFCISGKTTNQLPGADTNISYSIRRNIYVQRTPLNAPTFLLSLLPFSFVQAADKPVLTGGDTNPFSITRIHDRVNYMVSLNFYNGKTAQQWRSVDCKQGTAQLLYKDLLNDKGVMGMTI